MEESKKKRTKWGLARYLIEAKKGVDSILFIEDNKKELLNIGIRDEVESRRQQFYINCGEVLDARFSKKEKREICASNEIIQAVYYERDKHYAHKDIDYRPKEYRTLYEMADVMKTQIRCIHKECSDNLPKNITLNFVSHDKRLFRQIYHITSQIEEKIKKQKHPQYGQKVPKGAKRYPTKKVFHDTEEINRIPQSEQNKYAVILEDGLNSYEGLQNRQDFCIKMNVLFGGDAWSTPNMEVINYIEKLKKLGYLNVVELCQELPHADLRWTEIWRILGKIGIYNNI